MSEVRKNGPMIVAFITMLVVGTDLFVVSPLLSPIAESFSISVGKAGMSVTIFSLAYVIGAPIFGRLGDKFDKKMILVVGLLGFAMANLLTAVSPSYILFIIARAIAGAAAAAISPSVYALIGSNAPAENKGGWMSVAVAGFLISLTTGAPTGVYISEMSNWNTVFITIAVLSLFLAVLNGNIWEKDNKSPIEKEQKTSLKKKLKAVSITGIWGFCVYATYTYLSVGLQSAGGFSTALIAFSLVIYGVGAVIGSLSGGKLADRFGTKKIAALSLICLSLAEITLSSILNFAPELQIMTISLLGVFSIAAYPCLPAYQGFLIGQFPDESGSIMAWNSSIMYLGVSLGAAVGGVVFSNIGFIFVPLLSAMVGIAGGYLCYRLKL